MKRLPFLTSLAGTASLGLIAAFVACGGISDPTKGSGERVATVSGALTGTAVPANTRVALVWKVGSTGGFAVGSDVAVVNGKFTMDLAAPPDGYFVPAEGDYDGLSGGGAPVAVAAPDVPDDHPSGSSSGSSGASTSSTSGGGGSTSSSGGSTSSSGGSTSGGGQSFAFAGNLSPRDTVSGQISQPLAVAVAGFVVYVDTNGNGKLDIQGEWATPSDDVIGGNKELLLAYLRDGGALDYEKLRDRSGILPKAGYNLAWDEGRWLPLNVVELKISQNTKLPNAVCGGASPQEVPAAPPPSSSSSGSSGVVLGGYPAPNDPNLHCSPDGLSFEYTIPNDCSDHPPPEPEPAPVGLCAYWTDVTAPYPDCGPSTGYGTSIPEGSTPPDGWPCPFPTDGDAGVFDGDGGVFDGGAAPDAGK